MLVKKKTQYGGDVVMFLPKKIIINNKNYPQKNVSLAHSFKIMCNANIVFEDNSVFYFLLFC